MPVIPNWLPGTNLEKILL